MPSDNRKQVVLDPETLERLALIAAHLHADPERGRSQAIRFAAEQTVEALGLGKKKSKPAKPAP